MDNDNAKLVRQCIDSANFTANRKKGTVTESLLRKAAAALAQAERGYEICEAQYRSQSLAMQSANQEIVALRLQRDALRRALEQVHTEANVETSSSTDPIAALFKCMEISSAALATTPPASADKGATGG